MSAGEIAAAAARCDRRRHLPRIIFWVVVAMLLIAGAMPTSMVTPRALRADAHAAAVTIDNAIDQFHTDYGHLPSSTSAVAGHDFDSDSSVEENLITILKGADKTANPKGTDYLGDIKDAKTKGGRQFNGLVMDRETFAFVDPWGYPYRIRFDGDGDGFIEDPSKPGHRLEKKALVWSVGKDGDPTTWKDNAGSWEFAQ